MGEKLERIQDQAMMRRKNMSEQDLKLLQAIVSDRQPSLLPAVERLRERFLQMDNPRDSLCSGGPDLSSLEEREELREILADEMLERGLQENGEPNRYGLRIDELIGQLGSRR